MKPLFTIHAGEFLVDHEIERKFPNVNVWIPAKDTGIDLLVSDKDNKNTVSLQVKFSRDYAATTPYMKDALFHNVQAGGWWTPTRQQIEKSRAQYWVFVLVGVTNRKVDFIIIKPDDLLTRFNVIFKNNSMTKFHSYLWVTKDRKCWETRELKLPQLKEISAGTFTHDARDFTTYLNNWTPIKALNG